MILRAIVLYFVVATCKGTELPTNEYRMALASMTRDLAKVFTKEFINYYETGVESEALKSMTTMLTPSPGISRMEVEHMSIIDQSFICTACHSAVNVLLEYIRKNDETTDIAIRGIIVEICTTLKIESSEVCEGFFDLNWPIMKYILSDKKNNLNEEGVCSLLLQASNCVNTNKNFDWNINVAKGDEVIKSKPPSIGSNKDDLTILQLTDVHYDPNYKVGSLAACDKPMCCNKDFEESDNAKADQKDKLAGKWSDYRDCDVPWHMYLDTLEHIKKTHKKIDYIYYTGDVVDHGVWKTTYEGNKKSLRDVYKGMRQVLGDIKVFPVIGNHESQPLNQFAPSSITDEKLSTQWLYDFLAEEWSHWLPASTKETIRKGGYYTVSPKEGFRIITLNNNDCYTFNFWILHDPRYLMEQLNWLHSTLLQAEKDGEYVHILAHVPSGAGSCFNTWSREFRKIIERFHRIIGGIFNGHTHRDEFSVIYSHDKSKYAVNVAWNGGSLTPFSYVNPNYRIYKVEQNEYQVKTHDTWIFNLTLANMNSDESPIWFKEYSFAEAYGLNDLSPASLHELLNTFARKPTLLKKYWEHKVKRGDPSLAKGCDNKCLIKHLCEAATSQFDDMKRCKELSDEFTRTILGVGGGGSTGTQEKGGAITLQIFSSTIILVGVFSLLAHRILL